MRRRAALAAALVLAVALAGCGDAAGSIRVEPVTDAELADRASEPTAGADRYPAIDERRVARAIIDRGVMNVTAPRRPVRTDLPYEHEGRYYELSAAVIDERPGAATLVSIDYDPPGAPDPNATRLAFDALPAADRRRLRPRLERPPGRLRNGSDAEVLLGYPRAAAADSVLLSRAGERVVVRYRGRDRAIEVREPQKGPIRTFRYEATLVAAGPAAYTERLDDRYAFVLSGLTDRETAVFEAAIGDTYYAESTDDAGFEGLVDRFSAHEPVAGEAADGSWLVRYEGRRYWVELRAGGFEPTAPPSDTPSVTPHRAEEGGQTGSKTWTGHSSS